MNLQSLAGHTIDVDLLHVNPTVLDVGARGLDFTSEIRRLRNHARVVALEPGINSTFTGPNLNRFPYALVGDNRNRARYAEYSTGEGNFLTDMPEYYGATFREVDCINIENLMKFCDVQHWDVVKLDCEGSEFQILEMWPGRIATQISVEFHDSGYTPPFGPGSEMGAVNRLLDLGYKIVQHEHTKQGDGWGHWDSLFVLA